MLQAGGISNAGGAGLIPGQGTEIPHAMQHSQKFFKKLKWGLNWRVAVKVNEMSNINMKMSEI